MLYSDSDQHKDTFVKSIFKPFTDHEAIGGDPQRLANKLYEKYTVDTFSYHEDYVFFGVMGYFQKTVIPHKIEVYKAGLSLHDTPWVKHLNIDGPQFLDNLWLHDLSKFSAAEALGYAQHNFKDPTPTSKIAFEKAWHHHKMNNPHHPEYWLNPNRSGGMEVMPMPTIYMLEMLADWIGAGKTYDSSLEKWLPDNICKFYFHPETLKQLQQFLQNIGFETRIEGNYLHCK